TARPSCNVFRAIVVSCAGADMDASGCHRQPSVPTPREWTGAQRSGRRGRLDHDQPVIAGFAAPDFAGPAIQLSDIGVWFVAGEGSELFGHRIEADDG